MSDARLVPDEQEEITPGEAGAGMLLQGLGCAHRPLALTPQFFPNKPLDLLLRPGVRAAMCTRFKLGRTLAEVHAYGCALWLSELALASCAQERIAQRFHHLDTPSFSLSGTYVSESDQHAIAITHGSAKAHRPDLKQGVLALLVSQEGGVPLVSKRWDGKTSDTPIFKERAEALRAALARAPTPRSLGADATLDPEDTAATRAQRGFIPRMPGTLTLVSQVITQALQGDRGHRLDETTRYDGLELGHYGRAQRWLVVSSPAAMERAEARLTTAPQRAWATIETPRLHVHAKRFEPPDAAPAARMALAQAWHSQQLDPWQMIAPKRYAGKGRPTPTRPLQAPEWQMHAPVRPAQEVMAAHKPQSAGFVLGTNMPACHMRDAEGIRASKAQSRVEGGFRFLKDPWFLVSSLFGKKPSRMQGLRMVMTVAWLVYSLTQRRWRQQ